MAEPVRRLATYEDLCALPDNVVGEIIDGELFASPRPAARHALSSSTLGGDLSGPFHRGRGGPGGWWIIFEPELHLHGDIVVPDFAGWRRERMPKWPKEAAFFELAPDWVCEVLSPSTALLDRVRKMPVYAREGVAHLWLIDPLQKTLEVYRLANEKKWLLLDTHAGDARVRVEPFDAIELELNAWWVED